MPVTPYTGPFGRAELKHLLKRTLFGATNADLAFFDSWNLDGVSDHLLNFWNNASPPLKTYWRLNGNTPDPTLVDTAVPFGTTWVDTVNDPIAPDEATAERVFSFASWRAGLILEQERNLREKLTLFWYNHMPVELGAVFSGDMLYDYDRILRNHCMGNFRQMLLEVSKSPAMLIYLNGTLNTSVAPDENYARELMELFTLGEGSGYTEADVQAAARVLTGWQVRQFVNGVPIIPDVVFNTNLHSPGDKAFSTFFNNTVIQGQTGATAGEIELNALLDMILAKEEVSRFICRELYRFFVHGEIDSAAETDLVEPLAELFRANMGAPDQIRIVVKAMITSDHFFRNDLRNCMVMPPVDLVVGAIRKLKIPLPTAPEQLEARYWIYRQVYFLISYCGQDLYDPPNVAGWSAYHQFPQYDDIWLDTATYPARNNTLQGIIYNGFVTDDNFHQSTSRNLSFKVDLLAVVAEYSDPSDPNVIVAGTDDLLFAIPVSQGIRDTLKTNLLLLGQMNDIYWTDAYELYVADPDTTDMTAQLVPQILLWLFMDMSKAG
ncbi:MAG: DUF1800 domain-containing protein, partial [Flavobacteriales bacterium]|nr:DUF1800 domain-containing protein [Flavobacteriales bacterium]